MPCQQSRQYQRADCDGGWKHNTLRFFKRTDTQPGACLSSDKRVETWKGQQTGTALGLFELEAEPRGALHYSAAASLTHRPFM